MRIIAGRLKGRIITKAAPAGVRPTTDRARETLFSILCNMIDFEGIRVLDLCAGTGSLGLESLSRGAAFCCFVELSRRTGIEIQNTIRKFELESSEYEIHTLDSRMYAKRFSRGDDSPFHIIFADPPYKDKLINPLLRLVCENKLLTDGGIFVAEHDIREIIVLPDVYGIKTSRIFGETVVDFITIK
jgi:16S rRNA (guanine(966)-N(2))-methyltransferase RsmD